MNIETGTVYETAPACAAARQRGEPLVELTPALLERLEKQRHVLGFGRAARVRATRRQRRADRALHQIHQLVALSV